MLREHRKGTILLALGRPADAKPLLAASLRRFAQTLGGDNPLTGEARFCLAIADLQLIAPAAVTDDPFTKVPSVHTSLSIFAPFLCCYVVKDNAFWTGGTAGPPFTILICFNLT